MKCTGKGNVIIQSFVQKELRKKHKNVLQNLIGVKSIYYLLFICIESKGY